MLMSRLPRGLYVGWIYIIFFLSSSVLKGGSWIVSCSISVPLFPVNSVGPFLRASSDCPECGVSWAIYHDICPTTIVVRTRKSSEPFFTLCSFSVVQTRSFVGENTPRALMGPITWVLLLTLEVQFRWYGKQSRKTFWGSAYLFNQNLFLLSAFTPFFSGIFWERSFKNWISSPPFFLWLENKPKKESERERYQCSKTWLNPWNIPFQFHFP